jgi:hypothetical protein
MTYHTVRLTMRPGMATEKVEEALKSLRTQGRVIPSVISFVVGKDVGGEYEWGATYVIEDLDGYWEYLKHPAYRHTDEIGLPLVDKVHLLRRHRRRGPTDRREEDRRAAPPPLRGGPGPSPSWSPTSLPTAAAAPRARTRGPRFTGVPTTQDVREPPLCPALIEMLEPF